jgi:chemotaxis protein CheY-P-specific phosphatase CheC
LIIDIVKLALQALNQLLDYPPVSLGFKRIKGIESTPFFFFQKGCPWKIQDMC